MNEEWLHEHMGGILVAIEILWVGGVIAVFGFYFFMKRRLRKQKEKEQAEKAAAESAEELKEGEK